MPQGEPDQPPETPLRVAASLESVPDRILQTLITAFEGMDPSFIMLFVGGGPELSALSTLVAETYPDSIVVGCTTCGEIGPLGHTSGAASALALTPAHASACLIEGLDAFRFGDGKKIIQDLVWKAGLDLQTFHARRNELLLLTLTDGLSGMEEILITSLATYAPEVALIGGSAADNFRFEKTHVSVQGKTAARSAAVILLDPGMPFHVFQAHHYEVAGDSVVVTAADPARRLIHRIDGRPAPVVLAELLEIPLATLLEDPVLALSRHQAIFGIGTREAPMLRSVMGLQGEALLMGGAVEEGSILYPMRGGDLVSSSRDAVGLQVACVSDAQGILLFNCGGRLLEASSEGVVPELAQAMSPIPAAGFTTYGEQFGPMQLNHTLTGVVFGRPR